MPTLAVNKKATFDYEILETVSAGLVLHGYEVKAVRAGLASLKGSFVVPADHGREELYLINCHIGRYKYAGKLENYEPERSRQLLLKKREINHLLGKRQEQGLTLVPLKLYTRGSLIKLEIALGKGKKKFDKRETIKKRELKRKIDSLMKTRR